MDQIWSRMRNILKRIKILERISDSELSDQIRMGLEENPFIEDITDHRE